jgi:hypothetical protein
MVLFYIALTTNRLRLYDNEMQIFEKVVTGITQDESLIGIDLHPKTGKLYGIAATSAGLASLYIIDPNINPVSAPATLLGNLREGLRLIGLTSQIIGIDIDPNTDKLRLIAGAQNLSITISGADAGQTTVEGDINKNDFEIFGIAYTNPQVSSSTQLFDIGLQMEGPPTPGLFTQLVPDTGFVERIASLSGLQGINSEVFNAGFDIITTPGDINEAYTVIEEREDFGRVLNLYTVNLVTANCTFISSLENINSDDTLFGGFTVINTQPVPCLHPKTKVKISENNSVYIDTLKGGDTVIDYLNRPIKIVNNIEFERSKEFFIIKKGVLGTNRSGSIPVNSVVIKKHHPILFNGVEILPEKLQKILGKEKIKSIVLPEALPVYSLSTEKRTFVMMENLPVCTWQHSDLLKKRNKYRFKLL